MSLRDNLLHRQIVSPHSVRSRGNHKTTWRYIYYCTGKVYKYPKWNVNSYMMPHCCKSRHTLPPPVSIPIRGYHTRHHKSNMHSHHHHHHPRPVVLPMQVIQIRIKITTIKKRRERRTIRKQTPIHHHHHQRQQRQVPIQMNRIINILSYNHINQWNNNTYRPLNIYSIIIYYPL